MRLKDDRYIPVGKIGAPFGLNGTVKIVSFTECPEDIFNYSPWYINQKGQWIETEIKAYALQGKYLTATLAQCQEREQAQQWTNCQIAIKRSQLPPLPMGKYYWTDFEGVTVKMMTGQALGIVTEVMETGANPVLIIEGESRHLVPYLPEKVVKEVNLASNYLIVDWDCDF